MLAFDDVDESAVMHYNLCDRFAVYCSVPVITEEEARNALIQYCSNHYCYGKSAATNMVILSMESSTAYHVRLKNSWNIVYLALQLY